MKKIILKHSRSYGNDRYYPVCSLSTMICELLGRKSLTQDQINILVKYKLEVQYMGQDKIDFKQIYDEIKEIENEKPAQ